MIVEELIEWLKKNCRGDETVFIETKNGWLYPDEGKLNIEDWAEAEYGAMEVGLRRTVTGGYIVPWRLPLPGHIQQEVDGTVVGIPPR